MKKIYLYTITTLLLCSGAMQAQNPLGFPYEREWATYLPIYDLENEQSYTDFRNFWIFNVRSDGSIVVTTFNHSEQTDFSILDGLITPDAYKAIKTSIPEFFIGIINDKGKFEYGSYSGFEYASSTFLLNYNKSREFIPTDNRNNFYLSGATYTKMGIATPGSYQQNFKGNELISLNGDIYPLADGFIVKFNAETKKPEWGTYFNGDDGETAITDIKFDRNSLYFLGQTTSTSGIATPGVAYTDFKSTSSFMYSNFIAKMTDDGKTLLWCSYLPCTFGNNYNSFNLDSQGNIYYTDNKSVYKLDKDGNLIKEYKDILDETGTLFISPDDNIYIKGITDKDTPVLSTPGTYKVSQSSEKEYFLCSYNLDMQKQWGTYIIENNNSNFAFTNYTDFAFDHFNNPILMITTDKKELASSDAYQTAVQGKNDHLILSLNHDGQFNWATYYGGQKEEYGGRVVYHLGNENSKDALYFSGMTKSPTLIATEDSAYPKKNNPVDASIGYLAKFVPLVTASVDKAEESDFVLWPNPANELLHLRSNTVLTEQSMLTVYDLKGKKVLTVKADPANVQVINVSSLAKGSYILRVEDANNGINHSVKFVKK